MLLGIGLVALLALIAVGGFLAVPMIDIMERSPIFRNASWMQWGITAITILVLSELALVASWQTNHMGDWALACLAVLALLCTITYCVQQIIVPGIFPGLVPLPIAVVITMWSGRLFLEMAASPTKELPFQLPDSLCLVTQLVTGLVAGYSVARPLRIQRARLRMLVLLTAIGLGAAAGAVVHGWRGVEAGIWVQRLAVAACGLAVFTGSAAFRLGWHLVVL